MMKFKWLQIIFLGLIVAAGIYGSIQNLISTKDLGNLHEDTVLEWEKRFEPLKKRLPFNRGLIGYISDSSVPGAVYDANNDQGEYVLVQYVMSPIIIIKGTDQEWNIANLRPDAYKLWSQSNQNKFEVIQFSGNIYLLHKAGQ